MRGQIDIGIDITDRILASKRNIIFTTQIKLLIVGLYDQASLQG
jgi:hypothetical protein